MARITYKRKQFRETTLSVIDQANAILDEYAEQGYDLTLRQLYYQFVARGLIPNRQSEYDKLGSIVNDARLAGMIDWDHITDRTRNLRELPHWTSPADILAAGAKQYRVERWAEQPHRCEVWIEKDALVGVIEGICERLDVPFFSCRGYTSQSEAWAAGRRLGEHLQAGQEITILHLGDHDPSGIDMSRDIEERLLWFLTVDYWRTQPEEFTIEDSLEYVKDRFRLNRLALNMAQVEQYDPPPNPAKITDSRARGYIALHGRSSWELDALEPSVLSDLIENAIEGIRDDALWLEAETEEQAGRRMLAEASRDWSALRDWLEQRRNGDTP